MPKYKLTENGNIVIKDGNPVVIGDDEKEFTIDAIGAQAKIDTITAESNDRRKKLGDANTALEVFGDLDPVIARKAIEDVSGMSDKGKADLETQRDAINKGWEAKQTAWATKEVDLNTQLFDATTGSKFATSAVIKTLLLPPNIAQATFGKHFNPDGSANDAAGNPIYAKENPGKPAGFEEAMTHIIDQYPDKDSIIKASGSGGSNGQNQGDSQGGQTKSSLDKISGGLSKL